MFNHSIRLILCSHFTSFLTRNVQVCGLSILIGSQVWKGYVMSEKIYNIGQVLTTKKDIELEGGY